MRSSIDYAILTASLRLLALTLRSDAFNAPSGDEPGGNEVLLQYVKFLLNK